MMQARFHERVERAASAAKGRWREIFIAAGIDAHLIDGKARPCPLCAGTDRFVFDDKHGRGDYFCRQCGPGDGFALVGGFLGCGFVDALSFVENYCGLESWNQPQEGGASRNQTSDSSVAVPEVTAQRRLRHEMLEMWADAHPIQKGDAVYKYLSARGLDPTDAGFEIRCHENLSYWEDEGNELFFPAMIARVVDHNGCVVNLHRTYLTQDGQKASVDKVKKLMPFAVRGAAVQLGGKPADHLNLCEGIETALAVLHMTHRPTWATLGCSNLKAFEHIPDGVCRISIFADNDANFAGQSAAYSLAHALSIKGYEVDVQVPECVATDWLDELVGH